MGLFTIPQAGGQPGVGVEVTVMLGTLGVLVEVGLGVAVYVYVAIADGDGVGVGVRQPLGGA